MGGEEPLLKFICMTESASPALGDVPRGQFWVISFSGALSTL